MATLRRAMRMNRPGDFSRVFRQGKRTGGGGLTVLTVENTVGHPRLGLAIAKKHLKLASQRNRLKRIIRESFRQNQSVFPASTLWCCHDLASRNVTAQQYGQHWSDIG